MSDVNQARALLAEHFGFREFLEGQERVIGAVLDGADSVVIMPTGGGKSLCYQLPALLLEGITVVVSPLIALMKDQVDALTAKGIPATFINSSLTPAEMADRIGRLGRGEYRLVYIAPERFKSERFAQTLAPLSVALFAVDEAHCISQWGHDFRPDYLRLKWALRELGQPQVIALTATATPEVRADISEQLGLGQFGRQAPHVFVTGFARHNLTLAVRRVRGKAAKLERIAAVVREFPAGIVYCATRKNVERTAAALAATGVKCVAYHGAMSDETRRKAQDRFMSGKVPVAVATNAFGMGIDRADLRFVLHYDIPGSVEAYYQEAGRAGRDGEPARCELLFNYADVRTQEFFIEGANPTREVVASVYATVRRLCRNGPIELAMARIAEQVPAATNDMAVGTALYLLERAGAIAREYAPGSRTYTTGLIEPGREFAELEIDYDRLATKRERDLGKLQRMIGYADHHGCRHQYILGYFGDTEAAARCAACDNCQVSGDTPRRLPTADETVVIQKALSCVARVNGRFGRGRVAQCLIGSRAREVLDAGLDRLTTYGLLAEQGEDYVRRLLDELIQRGCVAVSTGEYPTLSLTPLGRAVMLAQQTVPLVMPAAETIAPRPTRARRGKEPAAPKDGETALGPDDARLFDALRDWRRQTAGRLGNLPAYLVYPDKTLAALARQKPRTMEELLTVRGIGAAKARRFGEETLAVLQRLAPANAK